MCLWSKYHVGKMHFWQNFFCSCTAGRIDSFSLRKYSFDGIVKMLQAMSKLEYFAYDVLSTSASSQFDNFHIYWAKLPFRHNVIKMAISYSIATLFRIQNHQSPAYMHRAFTLNAVSFREYCQFQSINYAQNETVVHFLLVV